MNTTKRNAMRRIASSALVVGLLAVGVPVGAQMKAEVQFSPGNYGTMLNGTVRGDEYFDYTLRAKGGQKMFVELNVTDSNGNGIVYFNILPPGSDGVAIYNSSVNGNSTTVELPESGEYAIRVYQMGNDRDSDKTSGFNVDVSIQ